MGACMHLSTSNELAEIGSMTKWSISLPLSSFLKQCASPCSTMYVC